MKKKHLLRSVLAIVLCVLLVGTAIAVGYTISEYQGKKVVIDKDNNMPVVRPNYGSASATVTTENGLTKDEVTLKTEDDSVVAVIPEGTKLNDGVNKVTLSVTEINNGQANVELDVNEEKSSFDVHVEGVASDNQTPIKVYIKEMLPAGLNMGNYKLYHVENGNTVEMTLFGDGEVAHNKFEYDAVSGDVTLYLASFSEIAVVSDTVNAWEGNYDYSWYYTKNADYIIANADQLAAFGAIVGGMAEGIEADSFTGKTVKLVADINIGDKENANESLIFHPIGYYYTDDKNADGTKGDYYSTVYSFEGTFDGNGHTVKNFYQNTWEIKGDYAGNYYDVAMGLFGYVVNGIVKNLTVDNFSSDGEFTPTGVIAAYAVNSTFENIAITNCNPRVYNTGNGGIIGVAGRENDNVEAITLKNITVDNSNKISALWGSWDVACGGLVGMYRGNVDGSGNATGDTISFENCHVAAQIDVNNDVCANYQYYAYRYAGMIIGSVRHNTTNEDGKTIPNMAGISATDCTVNYGTWNTYYYCELVANSIASYTHDYQFSRLTQVKAVNGTTITYLDDTTGTVPESGRYNYVVVSGEHSTENATCYHFVDGEVWTHDKAGTEKVDGKEVLIENNQHIYLPFHQLFTGYSWGVSSIGLEKYSGIVTNLDIEEGEQEESVEKFETKFNKDFLYRVGNGNIVYLESLFAAKDGATIINDGVWVTIEAVDENSAVSGAFAANTTDWTKGTIKFNGTGVVKVTIQDYNFCTPTVLYLEVVNGNNITSAIGSLDGTDVVLLNDVKVNSNGTVNYRYCTVYGNGFTFDVCGGMNQYNSKQGHGIIITVDATLDNLVVIGDVYKNYGAYTTKLNGTAQEDYTSAIDATNTIIQNCYIANCSAPVRGNGVTIIDTTLYGGTVANLILSGSTNTLTNVTTVNHKDERNIIGLGIVISDGANESTKLVLNGTLKQYNFISENDMNYVPGDYAPKIFNVMFTTTYSAYHFGSSPKYVNTGILSLTDTFDITDITDNTTNGYTGTVAEFKEANASGYLYSLPANGNEVNNDYDSSNDPHKSTVQGDYIPTFDFDLGDQTISNDGNDDTRYLTGDKNGIEALYQNNEAAITLDLTKLATIYKYNTNTCYQVSVSYIDANGNVIGTDTTVQLTTSGTVVFTVNDNIFYNSNGEKINKEVERSFEVPLTVSVKEAKIKNAEIAVNKTEISGDYNSSKYMTFNPLEAISITDYNASGTGTTVTLNKNIASKSVEYANSSSGAWGGATITITYTDGRVLTVHLGTSTLNSPGSSNGGKTITIQSDGSIKTDGKVASSSATGGTWTINGYSFKGNNGSTVTNNTKVIVKFADESSCVTGDTLVNLADGTQKRIDEVTYDDTLLVWNFFDGEYAYVPASVIFYHGDANYNVLTLIFEDGTTVKTINNHGFFDVVENNFVFIDETNVESFIGHSFVKVNDDTYTTVKLSGYTITEEFTGCYSIQSAQYINFIVEDMFSMTIPPIKGWFDYFEIGDNMKYNDEKMAEDIEKYGLYTYDDFKEYVTYEQFIAFNGPYLKVLVGRGVLTFEDILTLIATYVK